MFQPRRKWAAGNEYPVPPYVLNRESEQALGLSHWFPMMGVEPVGITDFARGIDYPGRLNSTNVTQGRNPFGGFAYSNDGTSGVHADTPEATWVGWPGDGNAFSLTCWFVSGGSQSASLGGVFQQASSSNRYAWRQTTASLILFINNSNVITSSKAITHGTAHHTAIVVRNTADHTLYHDGVNQGNDTTTRTVLGIDNLCIGRLNDVSPNFEYNGQIWDFRFYDRALRDAEVAAMHDSETRFELFHKTGRRTIYTVPAAAGILPQMIQQGLYASG